MEDKVTKFGNCAHNLIDYAEHHIQLSELSAQRYSEYDVFCDISEHIELCLGFIEDVIKGNGNSEVLVQPLESLASIGIAGYYYANSGGFTLNGIANYMTDLYARKNRDYGNSFDKSMDKFGLVVAAIRIGDKVNRLQSLIAKRGEAEVKDESLADTFIDLACYAIMTMMWIDGKNERESSQTME